MGTCKVAECCKAVYAKGVCEGHYRRLRKHGDASRGGPLRKRAQKGAPEKWLSEVAVRFTGEECLWWPFGRLSNGYGAIHVDGKLTTASRLVCERTHGSPLLPDLDAAHSCGNGSAGCVNPKHLRWATRSENLSDKADHGTAPQGQNNPASKLTSEDVCAIRQLKGKALQRDVATQFGVSPATISEIQAMKTWRHQ